MVQITDKGNSDNNISQSLLREKSTETISVKKRGRPAFQNKGEIEEENDSDSNLSFDDIDFEEAARQFMDFSDKIQTHIPAHKLDPNYHYVWKTHTNATQLLNIPNTFYEKASVEGYETVMDAGYSDKKGNRVKQVLLRCPLKYYKAIMKEQYIRSQERLSAIRIIKEQQDNFSNVKSKGNGYQMRLNQDLFHLDIKNEIYSKNNINIE